MKKRDIALIDKLCKRKPEGRKSLPGGAEAPVQNQRQEMTVFVLDISGSMACSDYPPSRFRAGVDAIGEFIEIKRQVKHKDLVGMVVFSGKPKVICAKCSLPHSARKILKPLSKIEPDGGTNIDKGLAEAGKLFISSGNDLLRRAILLTDGHGGDPEFVAEELKRGGVIIDVIGIGGSPSSVNESSLRKVASVIDGDCRYRFIADRTALLNHFRKIATDLVRSR